MEQGGHLDDVHAFCCKYLLAITIISCSTLHRTQQLTTPREYPKKQIPKESPKGITAYNQVFYLRVLFAATLISR